MNRQSTRRIGTAFLAGTSALLLTGCYAVAQGAVQASQIEQIVSEKLVTMGGQAPVAVRCDGSVKKIRGRTQHCAVETHTGTVGITVIVVDVEEDTAGFRLALTPDPGL